MSSKLNINRNIFLEKEELTRFQEFLTNSTVNQAVLENTTNWGIVRTTFDENFVDFKIETGTNIGTVKISNLSKAVDIDKLLIRQEPIDNISVPNDSNWYWVKISHKYSNLEVGECSINVDGEVSGINTLFTEVLRGQATEVPVKIKFYKSGGANNSQIYEIVDVTDNLNIILSGTGFIAESGLNYYVIGSTPLGETITSSQLGGLYQYDACNIELISEEALDTPPTIDFVQDKEFYLARVQNNSGTVTIQDKRMEFLTFNVEGVTDKLSKDPDDWSFTEDEKVTARSKIGAIGGSDLDAFFVDSGWKPMTRNNAASATGFDIWIRRVGKQCIVQGTFTSGNMVDNATVATIPYLSLYGLTEQTLPVLTEKVRFFAGPQVGDNDDNYGLFCYLPKASESDSTFIYIKVEAGTYNSSFGSKFNINFSFFLD